ETAADTLGPRLRDGTCPLGDAAAIESCLFAIAAANPNLSEVTFTHAIRSGFTGDGEPIVLAHDRWQLSVYRDRAGDDARLCTRHTRETPEGLVAAVRCRDPARTLLAAPPEELVRDVPDPTEHPTFVTPASRQVVGVTLRTDLSYAELDAGLPP